MPLSREMGKWRSKLSAPSKKEVKSVRDKFTGVTGKKVIQVPKEQQDNEKPVRKITFASAFVSTGNDGHPAPDPLLLAVKAGLNWSNFHGQTVMARRK